MPLRTIVRLYLDAWKAMAAIGIFLRMFLKKHKLHNPIKRKMYILTTTTTTIITTIKKHANT